MPKKIVALRLPREVITALVNVVGEEWVSQDRAIVETYSRFSVDIAGTLKKHLKDPSSIPACIVLPQSTGEVQAIVRIANRFAVPIVPFTNGFFTLSGCPSHKFHLIVKC